MFSDILSVVERATVTSDAPTQRIMFRCEVPEYHWQGIERVYALVGWNFELRDYEYVYPIAVIERILEVPNSAFSPNDTFRITKGDLTFVSALLQGDDEIIGFIHTHPPEQYKPSSADIAGVGESLFGAVLCEDRFVWFNSAGVFNALLITDF